MTKKLLLLQKKKLKNDVICILNPKGALLLFLV